MPNNRGFNMPTTTVFRSESIAQRTIELDQMERRVDPVRLNKQLKRGSWTFAGSLVVGAGMVLLILFGSGLEGPYSLLVGAILVVSLTLSVVSVLTTVGPALTAFALQGIQNSMLRVENLEVLAEMSELASTILKVVPSKAIPPELATRLQTMREAH